MRIAINGFGRIGRLVYRLLANQKDMQVVAINNPHPQEMMAHLLKYDSIHGKFPHEVKWNGETLSAGTQKSKMTLEMDPTKCPWGDLGVDMVLECSGVFLNREKSKKHLEAGAKHVLLSAPPKETAIPTFVYGVNHEKYNPEERITSNASCTTNCLAPTLRILIDEFGFEKGMFTTVHSYTNDQRLLDFPHKDYRRARAASHSMIPTTTGAGASTGRVIPEAAGKMDGLSIRVPTPNVSVVDLTVITKKTVTEEAVNQAFIKASRLDRWKGILEVTQEPLVSSDFNGTTASAIIDLPLTQVVDGNVVKVISWYDNETGFSQRMIDMARYMLSRNGLR